MKRLFLSIGLALVFLLSISPQGSARKIKGIKACDATGKRLGFLDSMWSRHIVSIYIPSLERFILINLNWGNIEWIIEDNYWPFFEDENCKTQPYFRVGGSDLISSGHGYYEYFIAPDTGSPTPRYYVLEPPVGQHTFWSSWEYGSCQTFTEPLTDYAVPGYLISLPFSTPVPLPLQFK